MKVEGRERGQRHLGIATEDSLAHKVGKVERVADEGHPAEEIGQTQDLHGLGHVDDGLQVFAQLDLVEFGIVVDFQLSLERWRLEQRHSNLTSIKQFHRVAMATHLVGGVRVGVDAFIGVTAIGVTAIGVGHGRHRLVLKGGQRPSGVAFAHRSVLLGATVVRGSRLHPPLLHHPVMKQTNKHTNKN